MQSIAELSEQARHIYKKYTVAYKKSMDDLHIAAKLTDEKLQTQGLKEISDNLEKINGTATEELEKITKTIQQRPLIGENLRLFNKITDAYLIFIKNSLDLFPGIIAQEKLKNYPEDKLTSDLEFIGDKIETFDNLVMYMYDYKNKKHQELGENYPAAVEIIDAKFKQQFDKLFNKILKHHNEILDNLQISEITFDNCFDVASANSHATDSDKIINGIYIQSKAVFDNIDYAILSADLFDEAAINVVSNKMALYLSKIEQVAKNKSEEIFKNLDIKIQELKGPTTTMKMV